MAVTSKMYGQFIVKALNKEVDFDSDDIRIALLTSAYTPNQDTHVYWADASASEITGSGYTAGGAALASKVVAYDGVTNTVKFDADDATWANSTITARYAVIYDNTPATNKPLIGYLDFGADQSSVNADFKVTFDVAGIGRVVVA